MDDLKHRILGLLHKQGATKIPSMGFSDSNYEFFQSETLSVNSKTATEANRPADQDILESIEGAYFAKEVDICRFELKKLPEMLECDNIQRDFKRLKQQHQVVANKVLQLILEQTGNCEEEFVRTLEVRGKLDDTLGLCRRGRNELNVAKRQFSSSLSILANYRKRKLVQNLLNSLNTIKTLHRTGHHLQELLAEENYAGAIELLQECQAAANTYRHFTCVASLTNKLQETLEDTEEKLDKVLAHTCFYFDRTRYGKLQAAYKLLGKTQIAVDHLHMHYTSAIYSTALNVVRANDANEPIDHAEKKPYDKLCSSIDQVTFIPCLVELCKSLFKIVLSYHQLHKWHFECEIPTSSDLEDTFNRQYVRQKLENGLAKVWHDVQSKVSTLLLSSDLASYKFDQFLQILGVVHKLIEVGEEFCGSKSDDLQESIRKQSVNYFRNYHTQRLDELRIFLENESWEICPVRPTFEVLQLQEFKALRTALKNQKTRTIGVVVDGNSSNHSQDSSTVTGNYFLRYSEHGTPFDRTLDDTVVEEDILLSLGDETYGYYSDETDDESDELKQEYVDDDATGTGPVSRKKEKHNSKSPILTNTSLSVLRQMGKYLQMSRLLRPIAYDIIQCLVQLFDFYMYAVHSFFACDLTVSSSSLYTLKLNATLTRIADSLVGDVTKPQPSNLVDLSRAELLHGLAERVAGVESLVFLSKQYEFVQAYMESLLPANNRIILQQFFAQIVFSDDANCIYNITVMGITSLFDMDSSVIKAGDYVIVQRLEYMKLHKIGENSSINLGKDVINLQNAIGHRFYGTFRMVLKPDSKRVYTLEKVSEVATRAPTETSGHDNRHLVDDGTSQCLTKEEIEDMRDSGSRDIVSELIANSKTFGSKTEYSQEKYLKKKEKKYCEHVLLRKPSVRLLVQMYNKQEAGKTLGVRIDDLSQILCYANVQADGQYLLYDGGTAGLLPAAILNAIGAENSGVLVHAHPGNECQKNAVLAMDFPREQLARCINVNLYSVLRSHYQEDMDDDEVVSDTADGKRKIEASCSQRKRKAWQVDNTRALEVLHGKVDAVIVVAKEHPLNIVKELVQFLKNGHVLVVFSLITEPLEELYFYLKNSADFVAVNVYSSFMRNYQVLPDRTHPEVTMNFGGYILTGYKIKV